MLIGSWESEDGDKMDIIDGFKPNTGPVIIYEDEEISNVYSWEIDPNSNNLKIRYSSGEFILSSRENLEWNRRNWEKKENIEITNLIDLKIDKDAFISKLTAVLIPEKEKLSDFSNSRGCGKSKAFMLPLVAIFSIKGPPGYPRFNNFATLSRDSPTASSTVSPSNI